MMHILKRANLCRRVILIPFQTEVTVTAISWKTYHYSPTLLRLQENLYTTQPLNLVPLAAHV